MVGQKSSERGQEVKGQRSEDRQGNINRKLPEAVCVQDGGMKDLKVMCQRFSCSPDDSVVLQTDHVSVRQGLGT